MRMYALFLFLHVLGTVVWVGGMVVMHFAVRPAAVALLAPPQRLPLMAAALQRFFALVTVSALAVPSKTSGHVTVEDRSSVSGGTQNACTSVLAVGVVPDVHSPDTRWSRSRLAMLLTDPDSTPAVKVELEATFSGLMVNAVLPAA